MKKDENKKASEFTFWIGQESEISQKEAFSSRTKKTELKMEELTTRQKLGLAMVGHIYKMADKQKQQDNIDYTLELIRNHSLGAIWVEPNMPDLAGIMKAIDEASDYPIIIVTDAESGIGEHIIGRHNSIGTTGSEELAYVFGKVTGITARKLGYNMICAPLLDLTHFNVACGGTVRHLGSDKYEVARLGAKISEGLHDAGVLSVAKHYPGGDHPKFTAGKERDSHMSSSSNPLTKDELLEHSLYPYLQLLKRDLMDGIMVGHTLFPNIDPEHPASISKPVIDIIREQGFDGVAMTDALEMMGIVAKFGKSLSKGMAIGNGIDLALTWIENDFSYNAIIESYEKGIIADERLDEAVRRVLEAQHKVTVYEKPAFSELTEKDLADFDRINRDSIYEKRDEGVSSALSKEGNHCFIVLTMNEMGIDAEGRITNDTMGYYWYRPAEIIKKIKAEFPNSTVMAVPQFSTGAQNWNIVQRALDFDDFVFVTFNEVEPCIGKERLTTRTLSVIDALQVSGKVSAVIHFGNPYVLEDLVHVPRLLIGGTSPKAGQYAIDILEGKYEAKGVLTYDVKLN